MLILITHFSLISAAATYWVLRVMPRFQPQWAMSWVDRSPRASRF